MSSMGSDSLQFHLSLRFFLSLEHFCSVVDLPEQVVLQTRDKQQWGQAFRVMMVFWKELILQLTAELEEWYSPVGSCLEAEKFIAVCHPKCCSVAVW